MIDRKEDPLAWAEEVLDHVHTMQTRWGKHYDVGRDSVYFPADIADAAGIILIELRSRSEITPEDLTKVKRQLTASKAREGKKQKQVDKLREELGDAQQEIQELGLAYDQLRESSEESGVDDS